MRKMDKLGFDNQKYLELQSAHIRERIRQFGNKLYLEFGGKLFDDHHASRVLPGFEPDSKIRMLKELRDSVEVVIAICASDIEKNKIRGDLGITYDVDVLRLIDAFRGEGLLVGSVVITQYAGQPAADAFRRRMEHLGVQTCRLPPQHRPDCQRRGLRQKRLYRDQPSPGGGDGPRPRQRQDGRLPLPALPRLQAGDQGGLRQV